MGRPYVVDPLCTDSPKFVSIFSVNFFLAGWKLSPGRSFEVTGRPALLTMIRLYF